MLPFVDKLIRKHKEDIYHRRCINRQFLEKQKRCDADPILKELSLWYHIFKRRLILKWVQWRCLEGHLTYTQRDTRTFPRKMHHQLSLEDEMLWAVFWADRAAQAASGSLFLERELCLNALTFLLYLVDWAGLETQKELQKWFLH